MKSDELSQVSRRHSYRRYGTDSDPQAGQSTPSKPLRSSPLATPIEAKPNPLEAVPTTRMSYSPRQETAEGLGIRRPVPQPSTSAPSRPGLYTAERRRGLSTASSKTPIRETSSPSSSLVGDAGTDRMRPRGDKRMTDEQERAAQEVAFERDYVVVEKKQVEVNAFADQMALYPQQSMSPKSGQIVRRATQQGVPTSTTGAIPTQPSRNLQIAQGRTDHYRQSSYDKALAGSPGSTTSAISKAIQDASLRLFGFKYTPPLISRGHSPPPDLQPLPGLPNTVYAPWAHRGREAERGAGRRGHPCSAMH